MFSHSLHPLSQICQDAYNNWAGSLKGREQELEALSLSSGLTKEQIRKRFAYLRQINKRASTGAKRSQSCMMMKSVVGPIMEAKKRKKVLVSIGDELLVGEKGGGGTSSSREEQHGEEEEEGKKGEGELPLEDAEHFDAEGGKGEGSDDKSDSASYQFPTTSQEDDCDDANSNSIKSEGMMKKKTLAQLTPDQLTRLEQTFESWGGSTKGRKEEISRLAIETGLTELQIRKKFDYLKRKVAKRLSELSSGIRKLSVAVHDIEVSLEQHQVPCIIFPHIPLSFLLLSTPHTVSSQCQARWCSSG